MRKKYKSAKIFFILSLLSLLISMPYSAALSQGRLERSATARVTDDENGFLKLKGFANRAYNMNGSYQVVGTITNNSYQTISLAVTVKPDFSLYHLFTRLGVRIGSSAYEFRIQTSAPRQFFLSLVPGQTIEVQAYLQQNFINVLTTEFEFTAADSTGTYTVKFSDTPRSPRRINLY